ncbi:type I-E CRISPR-associated protein Cas6/Cse3/CasE [Spiractinospora alimapuensis]|uniref:type I-E CRISPR-associated protein Cas6/Cse3/CasE n=1 Tax=Spiractinospora alimapuensis TaxID=2820884 RepID=UPI001F37920D|nr:type I-E CRISPR-associated protein Cas6/Cse3/CasE [Spiractinospora alimapuensis]QVQ51556.1 type I-E CRISPR-associated protein Cas6/Cse3/CasE [Spiractinospora alimapuensis]
MRLLLSKISMSPHRLGVQFAQAGDHHRMLLKALDTALGPTQSTTPRADAGLLFREEITRRGWSLLVQSQLPLDGDQLGPGYALDGTRDISPILNHLHEGRRVRYRVVAAPIRRLGKTDKPRDLIGANGERLPSGEITIPLRGRAAEQWWVGKAEAAGLIPESVLSRPVGNAVDNRRRNGRKPVRLPAVCFEGTARIRDGAAVGTALAHGIGRGKNFGLGLLSLTSGE